MLDAGNRVPLNHLVVRGKADDAAIGEIAIDDELISVKTIRYRRMAIHRHAVDGKH